MSEAVPPPANADHQMILEAFQRGWLDSATASEAIEELFRHRASGEAFDLSMWMEENGHLSASRIATLRLAGVTPSSGYPETVLESGSFAPESDLPPRFTALTEVDGAVRMESI